MKTLKMAVMGFAAVIALTAFSGSAKADSYGPNHPYTYGHNGYWDEHHGYHHWQQYNGHNGYWNRRSDGVSVFIRL